MATPETPSAIDGFLEPPQIAELEGGKTTRTIRNWVAAGKFPPPDAIRDGVPVWLRSTYRKYQAAVLAGEYRGRDRVAHLRGRPEAA
jgi:hypothetical protein